MAVPSGALYHSGGSGVYSNSVLREEDYPGDWDDGSLRCVDGCLMGCVASCCRGQLCYIYP